MDTVVQDICHAIRRIRTSPGFAATAIGIMGLGIGANTAIFSIVDTVLFKPPPYKDVDRVVNIYTVGGLAFSAHRWWFSAAQRFVFQFETGAFVSSELNVSTPGVVLLRQVRMNVALGKDNVR